MLQPNDSYTCTETLNWTAQFTQKMEEINQSSYTVLGPITARIVGFVSIPFVSLAEAGAHITLAAGKGITGLFVSPYNCLATTCFPDYSLPKELEFSSALVHVILTVECIFTAALLPFVCLLNPSRADAWMNSRLDKTQDLHNEILSDQPEGVNSKIEELTKEVQEITEKLARAKLRGQGRLVNKELQLKDSKFELEQLKIDNQNQIEELKLQHKQILENLEKEKEVAIANTMNDKNELILLKNEFETINSSKDAESNQIEAESELKINSLKHSLEITQIRMSHEEKIFDLESEFKAKLAKFAELENVKTKEIETLITTLEADRKLFAKEKRKFEKQLNLKNDEIIGLENDIDGMSSTYTSHQNQIKKLTEEKENLIKQLCEVTKEKQSMAIAKEQYDIRDIVNATELRQKHKNVIMQTSGTSLQYITLPRVEKLIDKIEDIINLVDKNPNIRLNFKMNGDDWEGDVEEIESENQFEEFLSDDPNIDFTKPVIFDNSTANVFLTNSTFDLGGSTIFTDSIISGQSTPDMDTLTGLREYFNKYKDAIEVSIQNKVNSPLTLNDKLILIRINQLKKMESTVSTTQANQNIRGSHMDL